MRAIVHIGTEKTGSTTIQAFLHENRESLQQQGIAYLKSPGLRNQRKLAVYSMDRKRSDNYIVKHHLREKKARNLWRKKFRQELDTEIAALPNSIDTIVFSSEHLHSRLDSDDEVKRLYRLLNRNFSEFKVLVYLRRQDQVAISLHSTKLLYGATPSAIFPPKASLGHHYYDYYGLINRWSSVFGKDNLKIRVFEREKLEGESLLTDFAYAASVKELENLVFPRKQNEKLSSNAQEHLLRFNRKYPRFRRFPKKSLNTFNDNTRELMLKGLNDFDHGPPLLPPRDECIGFYSIFKDSNQQLAKEYLGSRELFTEDFSMYPTVVEHLTPQQEELYAFDRMVRAIRRKLFRDRLLSAFSTGTKR
ncbi:MAG: hypothetical protein AAF699_03925 [Pseudomonadota bacterium]